MIVSNTSFSAFVYYLFIISATQCLLSVAYSDDMIIRVIRVKHVHCSFEVEDIGKQKSSVFEISGIILASINLACSELLKCSHNPFTNTPICTVQNIYSC